MTADAGHPPEPPVRAPALHAPGVGRWGWVRRRLTPGSYVAGMFLLAIVLLAAVPQLVARYDPIEIEPERMFTAPTRAFPFGTDQYGRDILSRVAYGARVTLGFALLATVISIGLSTGLGMLAGYYRGRVDRVIMRAVDLLLAFPGILLALIVVALLGPGLMTAMVAVGVGQAPAFTRITRSATLVVGGSAYIEATRAIGASDRRIIRYHILPNIRHTVLVLMTLGFAAAIQIGASLSFLGLGAQPPTPEWGSMLGDARGFVRTHWWIATLPGLALAGTLLAVNAIGDQLRDILDPRLVVD